ncbi:MAG: multidrug effflux MFS transporter [Reyranella sp.]|uniref:multidrug effflux MFS transporter n=1 Tax=Reyranella sp. TaxID=1929291 RepID=UPI003D103E58
MSAPLWLLTLITFSGTFAMHSFVPALPEAAQALGASLAEMQATMSVYIFGLAIGQLAYGPLSDRFGRRPVLMAGLVLYAAAGLAAAFVSDAHSLIVARLLQALGGSAGLVIGRAIVRDSALPHEAGRRLAVMNLMIVLGPGLAPLVGGVLAASLGWRSIFLGLALLGIVNLLFSWSLLPETRSADTMPRMSALARNYGRLLVSPAFVGFAVGGGCATTSMYAFLGASPFIFMQQLHRPDYEVGLYPAIVMAGVWLGTVAATRLIRRLPIDRLAVSANLLSVLASFVFLGAVLSNQLTVPLAIVPMFVFGIGVGVASPAALTQALGVDPAVIGSASGLYGFSQMGVGAICTTLVGVGTDPALTTAIILVGAGVVGQVAFWCAMRRRQP